MRLGDALVMFGDSTGHLMRVNGKTFKFEWSDRFGPLLISKKTGKTLENQNAPKLFFEAVSLWSKQGKRVSPDGFCVWRPEPTEVQEDRW